MRQPGDQRSATRWWIHWVTNSAAALLAGSPFLVGAARAHALRMAALALAFGLILVPFSRRWERQRPTNGGPRDAGAASVGGVEVPAKLRLVEEPGLRGRWREGIVVKQPDEVTFRPRRPRIGQPLDLAGSRIVGSRSKGTWDVWRFAGPKVLILTGPLGRFEVASASEANVNKLEEVFSRSSMA